MGIELKNKLCCYFDIAGFSDKVKNKEEEALNLLSNISEILEKLENANLNTIKFETTNYSDSVVVTCNCEEDENHIPDSNKVLLFLTGISLIHWTISTKGEILTTKGFITYGRCVNKKVMVFGPAIVKCVEAEKLIKLPIIEIDKNVYKSYRRIDNFKDKKLLFKLNYVGSPTILNNFYSIKNSKDAFTVYNNLLKKIKNKEQTIYTLESLFLLNCFLENDYQNTYKNNYKFKNWEKFYFHNLFIKRVY